MRKAFTFIVILAITIWATGCSTLKHTSYTKAPQVQHKIIKGGISSKDLVRVYPSEPTGYKEYAWGIPWEQIKEVKYFKDDNGLRIYYPDKTGKNRYYFVDGKFIGHLDILGKGNVAGKLVNELSEVHGWAHLSIQKEMSAWHWIGATTSIVVYEFRDTDTSALLIVSSKELNWFKKD